MKDKAIKNKKAHRLPLASTIDNQSKRKIKERIEQERNYANGEASKELTINNSSLNDM